MNRKTIRKVIACSAAGIVLATGGFAAVSAASDSPTERPEFGIDPGPAGPVPVFVAVSDGHHGIAGYSELALMNGSADDAPQSPEEALERASDAGVIIRVFNTDAKVVGYFASRVGFVDEAGKVVLVAEGWRYLEGSTPTPAP